MVHDLVRDFCMAQFKPETQAKVHLALVNAFVQNRTVTAHGQKRWDPMNTDDEMTIYVLSSIQHHMSEAFAGGQSGTAASQALRWLDQLPHDIISVTAARQLGEPALKKEAAAAESSGDDWSAACRLAALGQLQRDAAGGNVACASFRNCFESIDRLNAKGGCTGTGQHFQDNQSQYKLDGVRNDCLLQLLRIACSKSKCVVAVGNDHGRQSAADAGGRNSRGSNGRRLATPSAL